MNKYQLDLPTIKFIHIAETILNKCLLLSDKLHKGRQLNFNVQCSQYPIHSSVDNSSASNYGWKLSSEGSRTSKFYNLDDSLRDLNFEPVNTGESSELYEMLVWGSKWKTSNGKIQKWLKNEAICLRMGITKADGKCATCILLTDWNKSKSQGNVLNNPTDLV